MATEVRLSVRRDYGSWHSPALGRTLEYLWFGSAGRPALLFPTSMGRFYQNEDFGIVGALADKIDRGELQLACVDSIDQESWYAHAAHPADRARRHDEYDRYLREEMIPFILHRAGAERVSLFGASFGAYHAANIAGRYPELVEKAILFSGLYDVHRFLDGYWDDTCYFHCPTAYIANLDGDWTARLARVGWIIATGEHDTLVADNRAFSSLLWSKGIPNHAEFWPGVFGHDWPYWRENVRRFLP